jgi:predicted nucleotide-binding protein (sugar kinase/HSP70/actin superfamily)
MDKNIRIGIPKALLYYKYAALWENFFNELGCEVICSPETNQEILEEGKRLSIDESCLSLKIFIGHVSYLVDKVDYVLIPRIVSLKKGEKVCTNFYALYDIVNNIFNVKILNYNVDVEHGKTEKKGFIEMGKTINKSKKTSKRAYSRALRILKRKRCHQIIRQNILFETSNRIKILLVSHPYNAYDKLIGETIIKHLEKNNVDIINADVFDHGEIKGKHNVISKKVYWTFSKELLGSIMHYYQKVDGIILLSVFPCGPDSLTNEMCMRKIKKPITNIIIDELSGEAGLQTRIESFVDIIKSQMGGK